MCCAIIGGGLLCYLQHPPGLAGWLGEPGWLQETSAACVDISGHTWAYLGVLTPFTCLVFLTSHFQNCFHGLLRVLIVQMRHMPCADWLDLPRFQDGHEPEEQQLQASRADGTTQESCFLCHPLSMSFQMCIRALMQQLWYSLNMSRHLLYIVLSTSRTAQGGGGSFKDS